MEIRKLLGLRKLRDVRLGAIWAADHNLVYFYDARGERYLKIKLARRLMDDDPTPLREAA